jgi:hypothetical protein
MSGKQEAEESEPEGPALMGQRLQARDHMDLIKTAVDASPTKVAVVGVRVPDGSKGFGAYDAVNSQPFDHVLIAYYDYDKQDYVIAEMMPGEGSDPDDNYSRLFGSQSNPGTLPETANMWHRVVAVPVTLTPEQDALLRSSVAKNLSGGNTYSFFSEQGNTCASGVRKVLMDAKVWDWTEQGFWAELEKAGLNIVQPGTVLEWAAQRGGVVYVSQIYTRSPSPDAPEGGLAMDAQEPVEKATQIRSSSTAAEKESYIRSAVEGSPHKMVIIVVKEPGQDDHLTVAWIDDNNNLVFAKKVQNVTYTKHPENSGGKEFGNPELTSETLQGLASNNKTVEVIPIDFTAKYGPQAAATKAAVFKAVLEKELTGDNASNRAQDALDKAIESVDSSYGISFKTVLQGAWDHFRAAYPDAAELFAKLLVKHFFGVAQMERPIWWPRS